jgi:signal peptidase II
MGRAMRRWLPPLLLGLAVILIDQWTKAAIVRGLGPAAPVHRRQYGPEWLALEYAENRGAAFGLLGGSPWLVGLLAAAIAFGIVVYVYRQSHFSVALLTGAGLTLGGAAANLIDRARLGYVVDFVSIGVWPNFNVADAAISGGVLLLALDLVTRPETTTQSGEQSDAG